MSEATSPQPRFNVLRFLGRGGQGFVQLAIDSKNGQACAIKYIDRGWSRAFYKYVSREILNHASLSLCKHPHIVEFQEVFLTPRYLGIVMEFVEGTNLQQYLEMQGGSISEDVARFIFQQLIIAVDFCHRHGKVNRDIKLANILLHLDGTQLPLVKLCDFGFSKDKLDDSEPQTQIGTALFTAPEIFTNTQNLAYDGQAADVWSCSIVLFVMLFGGHPFLSTDDCHLNKQAQVMKLIANSVSGNLVWPPQAASMPLAADLLTRVLVPRPSERYTIADITMHPWFLQRLPPGALQLNQAYAKVRPVPGEVRQTPEAIKQVVRAAVMGHGEQQQPGMSAWTTSTAPAPAPSNQWGEQSGTPGHGGAVNGPAAHGASAAMGDSFGMQGQQSMHSQQGLQGQHGQQSQQFSQGQQGQLPPHMQGQGQHQMQGGQQQLQQQQQLQRQTTQQSHQSHQGQQSQQPSHMQGQAQGQQWTVQQGQGLQNRGSGLTQDQGTDGQGYGHGHPHGADRANATLLTSDIGCQGLSGPLNPLKGIGYGHVDDSGGMSFGGGSMDLQMLALMGEPSSLGVSGALA